MTNICKTWLLYEQSIRMARLANIGRDLTPFALRQLYNACVTSIADYGSIIWWKGNQITSIKLLQGLQNSATRKILGVFKTAPVLPIEVESALPPPEIRLNATVRAYALGLFKLSPSHPVNYAINDSINPTTLPRKPRNKKTPQLQRIYYSISNLYSSDDLEKIKHFYFAPWEMETPYKVYISKASKEEEAKDHLQVTQNNPCNNIFIYTDASSTNTPRTTGIGI